MASSDALRNANDQRIVTFTHPPVNVKKGAVKICLPNFPHLLTDYFIDTPPWNSCKLEFMKIRQATRQKKCDRGWITKCSILFTLLLLYGSAVAAAPGQFPSPTGHVNDFAGVVDEGTRARLEILLTNFENRTGAQLAVVTLQSLEGRPIEEYANELYRAWGIGAKSGDRKDQGALLLIALQDRQSRLEVGYGLEGDLPDGLAGELIRRMRPFLKQSDYSQAVWVGTRSIVDTLAERWQISLEGIEDRQYAWKKKRDRPTLNPVVIFIIIIAILIIIGVISSFFRGGGGRGNGSGGDLWWLAPIIFNGSGGSFGGGSRGNHSGWGSSGGGSDWGGFGGGSSGGGGASDSW